MTYEDALAWLRGERSMCNLVSQHPFETWQERVANTDAALTQQAYWIARAHHEGLALGARTATRPTGGAA